MGIVAAVLRKFHGGVHPKGHKELTALCAITPLPMPERLYVPLLQHMGKPSEPCVRPGDRVLKGDLIGRQDGFISAPVHASTSGTVVGIEEYPVGHPSGLTLPCVVIEPDGEDRWNPELKGVSNPLRADPALIRAKIKECGIVGLGGATFPSYVKMSPPPEKKVQLLLINGAECEPYLTCDARVMEEQANELVAGIEIMMYTLGAPECVIGIESNKPNAITALKVATQGKNNIQVIPLAVMYPQGGEKQLIEVITGRQVPSGGLPIDVGVIVHNVGTCVAIHDAVVLGRPLVQRAVTVTGQGIANPANILAPLGAPIADLIKYCGGLKYKAKKVISGGPMMGVALTDTRAPVMKGTSGILALTEAEMGEERPERPCIRCGNCVTVCPIGLMPTDMAFLSRHDQFDRLSDYNLFDCIECGSCAFVCPSAIPLVHYFRYGKLSIQGKDREKKRKELDRQRTKEKEARTAAELAEKERKKAEMKAQMAARKPAATPAPAAEAAPAVETAPADDKAARAARAAAAAKAAAAARAAKAAAAPVAVTQDEPAAAPAAEPAAVAESAVTGEDAAKAARVARAALASRAAAAARAARAAAAAGPAAGAVEPVEAAKPAVRSPRATRAPKPPAEGTGEA